MKIVHLVNYFMPELGYQEYFLARYHASSGHDVHIITSNRAYPPQKSYATFSSIYPSRKLSTGKSHLDGFTVHRLPAFAEINMQLLLGGSMSLLNRIAPELVISHGVTRFETLRLLAYRLLSRSDFKLIVDDHTLYSAYSPTMLRRAYYAFVGGYLRLFRTQIARIVPVASETAEFLHQELAVPYESMTVIPIGADTDLFTFDEAARRAVRQSLGLRKDAFLILYVGKLTRDKGIDVLYHAARPVLRHDDAATLLFVGSGIDGEAATTIRRLAWDDGLTDRVLFVPHVSHESLPGYFSACDVAVWPLQETMAALEAASCGRPLVLPASQVGRERVADGNGFACSSEVEITRALTQLLEQPELRAVMGVRGQDFVRRGLSWQRLAQAFLEAGGINHP